MIFKGKKLRAQHMATLLSTLVFEDYLKNLSFYAL